MPRLMRDSIAITRDESLVHLHSMLSAQQLLSAASLALLLWEYLLTIHLEYRYIWKLRLNQERAAYLFSRYFGLTAVIVHLYLVSTSRFSIPVEVKACRIWFGFLYTSAAILGAIMDYVLILRVYALYNRSKQVICFLAALFLVQVSVSVMHGVRDFNFDGACNVMGAPIEGAYLGALICVFQSSIWYLTLSYKRSTISRRMYPLTRIVVRDGSAIYILMCAIVIIAAPLAYMWKGSIPSIAILLGPHTFFAIATCRIVLNTQRFRVSDVNSFYITRETGLGDSEFSVTSSPSHPHIEQAHEERS